MTPNKQKKGTVDSLSQTFPDALLTTEQAAAWLGYTPRFLEARRRKKTGPQPVPISKRAVRYRKCDLVEWVDSLVRASTSDKGPSS